MTQNEKKNNESTNTEACGKKLWSQFLNEVRDNSCNQVAQRRCLLFLGNSNAGKASLIAQLQGVTEVKRGNGLEYHYLDVKEEGRNEHMKLSVWVSDGDPALSYILNYALTEVTFPDCLAVLVVSMDEPWDILDSLQRWADILENQVQRLRLSKDELQEYKESMIRHFCSYVEPDLFTGGSDSGGVGAVSGIPSGMTMSISTHLGLSSLTSTTDGSLLTGPSTSRRRVVENPLHPSAFNCGVASPSSTTTTTTTVHHFNHKESSQTNGKKESDASDYEDDDDEQTTPRRILSSDGHLSLSQGVFEKNLGIPIVVVVTKVDCMPLLRKEHNFSDEYFDFMQMHIRQFCLKYGAGLVYTSVREDKNCDLLNRYLRHRVFGFPFQHSAYVVEADSVFVPSGWDDPRKINILHRSLVNVKPTQSYSEVFPRPNINRARGPSQKEQEIVAEDEQVLLSRLAIMLSKLQTQQQQQQTPGNTNSGGASPNFDITAAIARVSSASNPNDSSQFSPITPRTSAAIRKPHVAMSAMSAAAATNSPAGVAGSVSAGSNERVLTSFFNSLLTKQRAANSSPSPTQQQSTNLKGDSDGKIEGDESQ